MGYMQQRHGACLGSLYGSDLVGIYRTAGPVPFDRCGQSADSRGLRRGIFPGGPKEHDHTRFAGQVWGSNGAGDTSLLLAGGGYVYI